MNYSAHLVAASVAAELGKRRYVAAVVIALAVLACSVLPTTAVAAGPASCYKHIREGYVAASFHLLEAGKSSKNTPVRFYNYSFAHRTCANHLNVEWPMDLLAKDNASKERIENEMALFFPYGGAEPITSTDYARINDGAGAFWAGDAGWKTAAESCGTSDVHYRIYAYSQRSFAIGLGYFVMGALHKDNNEGPGCKLGTRTFGESEKAEKTFGTDAKTFEERGKWEVSPDTYDMQNQENNRREGNHIFENDGRATIIDAH